MNVATMVRMLFFQLPIGTIVKKTDGDIVCELKKHEQKFIAARGGLGEIMRLVL